jgi:hypothetical protein
MRTIGQSPGAITEVRIVMHGVGHGYEFSVLNDVDIPDDARYFERPGIIVLQMTTGNVHGNSSSPRLRRNRPRTHSKDG